MKRVYLTLLPALVLCASAASAQGNDNCARTLTQDSLRIAEAEAAALGNDFRDAFSSMTLDKATSTVSTVGATLMGNALSREVSATIDGLRHMLALRDEVPLTMREVVVSRFALELGDASNRMRKVSISYGQVARMANLINVQELAGNGAQFADTMAKQWGCK